jgi:hypothetical protein
MNVKVTALLALVFLNGCNTSEDALACKDSTPVVAKGDAFLEGLDLDMYVHQRKGDISAVACHNCYDYNSQVAASTISLIDGAIQDNNQLIELDVIFDDESQQWFINHGSNRRFVSLEQILFSENLRDANNGIFLEVKGDNYTELNLATLFHKFKEVENFFGDLAYFNQQRFLTIRSQSGFSFVRTVKDVLNDTEFSDIKAFVKLSKILKPRSLASMKKKVELSKQCGVHMVEFSNKTFVDDIKELASYAKSIDLGTSIHTIDETNYKVFVEGLQGNIDVFNVEPVRHEASIYRTDSLTHNIARILNGS